MSPTDFFSDFKFALRQIWRRPLHAFLVVLTLTLGIGANTAIFSLVNGVMIRPLPYEDGEELVVVSFERNLNGREVVTFSPPEYDDIVEQAKTMEEVAEYHTMWFTLLGGEVPERVQTGVVSANFFDMLGVEPVLGRGFAAGDGDPGATPVLVISHDYWRRSHGSDPSILGKVFELNDKPHTVVGVLPSIPQFPDENDVFMTSSACPFRSNQAVRESRSARMLKLFGRRHAEVSLEQVRSDFASVAGGFVEQYPDVYPMDSRYEIKVRSLSDVLTEDVRRRLLVLMATVGLVLMIGCFNVASLISARLIQREQEMAVRSSLGAGRLRLLRQLLAENLTLTVLGGIGGTIAAYGVLHLLVSFISRFTSHTDSIGIDDFVLSFTLVLSLLTGVGIGLISVAAARKNVFSPLRQGGFRNSADISGRRARNLFIVFQLALSFVLLVSTGLLIRSLTKLQEVDLGFDTSRVLTLVLDLNWSKYDSTEKVLDFAIPLLERVERTPGVASAAMASAYPFQTGLNALPENRTFRIGGRPIPEKGKEPVASMRTVSAGFFVTLGIPLLEGREFSPHDDHDAPFVAIVNQLMASRYWGEQSPLGEHLIRPDGRSWEIVGVVGDVRQYGFDSEVQPTVYLPFRQPMDRQLGPSLLVRSEAEPMQIARQVRERVYSVDPEQPVSRVVTLEDQVARNLDGPRLTTILLGLFAVLAMVIALTGVGGVMALSVGQRQNEIGIRIAMGATRCSILVLVLRQGMMVVVGGLLAGVGGALFLSRLLSGLLYGVEPSDPATLALVFCALAGAAGLVCLATARRAASVEPVDALRCD